MNKDMKLEQILDDATYDFIAEDIIKNCGRIMGATFHQQEYQAVKSAIKRYARGELKGLYEEFR